MSKRVFGLFLMYVGLVSFFAPLWADEVTVREEFIVYTEDFPPYNYLAPDGTVVGQSTKRVRQVLDEAGLSYTIQIVPWSRAVQLAKTEKNVLIYTLARTPARDMFFDWLIPLIKSEYHLYARAEDMRPVTPEALRAGEFRAVCVTANISCELLAWIGVPADKLIRLPNEGFLDIQMVMVGRADVYFNDYEGNAAQLKQAGYSPRVVRDAMKVDYNGGFFLAAGLQVSSGVRQRIRETFDRLQQQGRIDTPDKELVTHEPITDPKG